MMESVMNRITDSIFVPRVEESTPITRTDRVAAANEGFDNMLQSAMQTLEETNRLQFEADWWQLQFATGQTDDVLAVVLAQERAHSALNFTVQVTNTIIEAYREIMRMPL